MLDNQELLSANVREDLRRQFEADWLAHRPRPIREYLPLESEISYRPTLVELICIELEFRRRKRRSDPGEPCPAIEDYVRDFPVLQNVSLLRRIVREEWLIRAAEGESPNIDEFRQRFPQLVDVAESHLRPESGEIDERTRHDSTAPAGADDIRTLDHIPRAADGELDPTLTFCVRRKDGAMQIPAAAEEQERVTGFARNIRIADRYQLDRELGRGGMGRVFLAHDVRLDRFVAIKVMLVRPPWRTAAEHQEWQRMFAEEARLGAGLFHPAIATVFDYGLHEGLPYTVFEYIRGISLRDLIRQRAPLPLEDIRRIIAPLAQGLDFAHQQRVVHRDLKPENIRATEGEQFKILDLGLAKRFDLSENDWHFSGTPAYAAPEQAAEQPSDGRVDQYALGLITFELLTGRRPFSATTPWEYLDLHQHAAPPSPGEFVPELPQAVCAAVLKSLAKDAHERFASCEEFATAIGCRLLSQVATLPPPLLEQDVRLSRSSLSLGWSQTVRGAHLLLLPDALWIYHRGEIHRWPLEGVEDVRQSFQGNSLQVTWKGETTRWQQQWRFPNTAECGRWVEGLRIAAQQARLVPATAKISPARPPLMILRSRPHVLLQMLGHMEARQPSRWAAVASLSLRAAAAGADAVVDVVPERLFGPQRTEYRLSGRPVKVANDQGIVELATRWSAEEISHLAASTGLLATLVLGVLAGLAILPILVRWLAGGSLGLPGVVLDSIGEFAVGLTVPLIGCLIGPCLLMLLLLWLKWPQLVRLVSRATRLIAVTPIVGKVVATLIFGLAPRDWYGQLRVLAELAAHLLFAFWFWELARQLGQLANQLEVLFARCEASRVRSVVVRALSGATVVYAGVAIVLTSWLSYGTLRDSGSVHLLAESLNQRLRPLQQQLQERQQAVGPTDSKITVIAQLTEQARRRDAMRPTSRSEAIAQIARAAADEDPKVRVAVCNAFSAVRANTREAIDALVKCLADDDAAVRNAAFQAVRTIQQNSRQAALPGLLPALLQYLLVCDITTREDVASLLQQLDRDWTSREEAFALAKQLARELRADDRNTRIRAMELLARLGAAARPTLPLLAEALGDANYSVRSTARRVLDNLDPGWQRSESGKAIANKLVLQLANESLDERVAAAEMLSVWDTDWNRLAAARDAVPGLIGALAVAEQTQQISLVAVLDRIDAEWRKNQNCESSVAVLIERLNSTNSEEQRSAVAGLRIFGNAAASSVGALLDRILEHRAEGSTYLVFALDAIDPKWGQSPACAERMDVIAQQARHSQTSRRLATIQLLNRIGTANAKVADLLMERLADEDVWVRRAARESLANQSDQNGRELVPRLIPALLLGYRDQTADETQSLASILDRLDKSWRSHPAAVATCEQAGHRLQAESVEERRSAVQVLKLFGESAKPWIPLIVPLLIDQDAATRVAALATMQRLNPHWPSSPEFRSLLPHVVRRLEGDDVELRLAAIRLLGYAGPPAQKENSLLDEWQKWLASNLPQNAQMVRALGRQMDDPEPRVREAAATTLGKLQSYAATAVLPLARHLADTSPEVRRAAKSAITQVNAQWRRDPELAAAIPDLVRQFENAPLETRVLVLETLAFLGPAAAPATDRIAAALEDPELRVQRKAIEALAQIGPSAESALAALAKKRGNPTQRQLAEQALTRINPNWLNVVPQTDFVNVMRESLKGQPSQRPEALMQLRNMGTRAKDALPDIAAFVVDADDRTRRGSLEALDAIDPQWRETAVGEQVLKALMASLSEANDSVRWTSAMALRRFGRRAAPAQPGLVSLAQHPDSRLREVALETIGEVCEAEAEVIEVLAKSLRNSSSSTRTVAMKSLARLKPDWHSHPTMSNVLDEWLTQLNSRQSPKKLESLERIRTIPVPNEVLVRDVKNAVSDGDQTVRLAAIAVLKNWGTAAKAAVPELIAAMEKDSRYVRDSASVALGAVNPNWRQDSVAIDLKNRARQQLQDGSAEARRLGVELLSHLAQGNADENLVLILPCLGDDDEMVHRLASSALSHARKSWREDPRVVAQVALWQKQLLEPTRERCLGAARALAEASPSSAVTLNTIIAMTDHSEPQVRAIALRAISKFDAELPASLAARDAVMRRLGDSTTYYAARILLDSKWRQWRESDAARQQATALVERLASNDAKEVLDTVTALGTFGSAARPAVLPLLKLCLDAQLQKPVWNSLNGIDPKWRELPEVQTGIEWLSGELSTSETARKTLVVQTLGQTNASAVPALLDALQDSDIRMRIAVIQSLGNLGAAEALPALREQLQVPAAKQTAEYAIRQIETAQRK